jgi:uncharacterized protein (DUF1778 family)
MEKVKTARFDTRWSEEQKDFFERAAVLGGYRTLSEFVIITLQEKAQKIVKEKKEILASERDRQIFFDALLNPASPNAALKAAADEYREFTQKQ